MDSSRRHSITSPAFPFIKENCIHTKNIIALFDMSREEESYHRLHKHLSGCDVCQKAYKHFELKNFEAKVYIPKPQIDSETKLVFEGEVHEIFKTFDLNEKERLKKKIKSNIKKLDNAGIDFIRNLGSKSMLKTYALGAVLFVLLRQFFS